MNEETTLRTSLTDGLSLPPDAVEWLCSLYAVTQVFDDFADGDPVDRADLNRALYESLVGMSLNPFFDLNRFTLRPVLALFIMKWQASDQAERGGNANEVSFVWRSGFYDVVMTVFLIVHGRENTEANAQLIMSLYGESYADYRKEFP